MPVGKDDRSAIRRHIMSVTQQDKLPLLRRRAIVPDIPLLDFLKKDKQARGPLSRSHWVGADDKVNIDNVQGDVYPTFPRVIVLSPFAIRLVDDLLYTEMGTLFVLQNRRRLPVQEGPLQIL